jgi:hypothetical protein
MRSFEIYHLIYQIAASGSTYSSWFSILLKRCSAAWLIFGIYRCNGPVGVDIPTLLYQYFAVRITLLIEVDIFEMVLTLGFPQDENVTYKCEECQCTEAVVQKKIERAPRILVLHLKRFTKDMFEDVCRKRSDCIQVQPNLNIGVYNSHCSP